MENKKQPVHEAVRTDCPKCNKYREKGGNYCGRCGRVLKPIELIPPEYRPGEWQKGRSI